MGITFRSWGYLIFLRVSKVSERVQNIIELLALVRLFLSTRLGLFTIFRVHPFIFTWFYDIPDLCFDYHDKNKGRNMPRRAIMIPHGWAIVMRILGVGFHKYVIRSNFTYRGTRVFVVVTNKTLLTILGIYPCLGKGLLFFLLNTFSQTDHNIWFRLSSDIL